MKDKIAICVSTRNRPEAFDMCLREWVTCVPWSPNVAYFVVDDASDIPYPNHDFRFSSRVGIPRAKNKSLELAMDWGADHIFLCDDDVYPISPNAIIPYINSPHPHLCYTFLPHQRIVDGHKYHSMANGCMMYIHRSVVEKIGGFDTRFGLGKFEHVQFSHRVHAAGLIPHPFIDVLGSDKLFHAMDEHNEISRTFTQQEQAHLLNVNRAHYYKTRNLTEFIPYKS
jgi:glycosyltransferase involved in cell wall biosynthesis